MHQGKVFGTSGKISCKVQCEARVEVPEEPVSPPPAVKEEQESTSVGAVIAIIVIVLLVIALLLKLAYTYIFSKRKKLLLEHFSQINIYFPPFFILYVSYE